MSPQMNGLLAILAAAMVVGVAARFGVVAGGWRPIGDLNDPDVKSIADFAVKEYNKQSKSSLVLKSIEKGESQVVAGTDYRLVLVVSNGQSPKYRAIVWEKPWKHYRNLTSFEPLSN